MNAVILSPISNKYMPYFDVIANDTKNSYLIFIMKIHRDNYPEVLPRNIKIVELSIWNEEYIDYCIADYISYNKKIDVVFAYTEEQIEFAARLREKYNIPGQSTKSAEEFRNKYTMITTAKKAQVAVPDYQKVNNVFELIDASKFLGYPFIIKPIDGMGSMNTYVIRNEKDMMDVAKNEVIKDYLAEKYIDWPLYHVDGFVCDSKLVYLIPSKYFDNTLAFKQGESGGSVQIGEDDSLYSKIEDYTNKLLRGFDTPKNYLFHLEVFSNGKDIVLCEIASRLCGGRILQEIEAEFGFSPVKELLKLELNKPSKINKNSRYHTKKIRGVLLVIPGEGKLVKLPEGVPNKIPFEGVFDYCQYAKIGRIYEGANSSISATAAICVVGDDPKKVFDTLSSIDKWFQENTTYEK